MKLKKETQLLIKNAVDVASTLGIESIVMDGISLRGENKELGVVIIMPTKDLELGIDAIGIGNVPSLKTRLHLLDDSEIKIDRMERYTEEVMVGKLTMTTGRTKVTFKCADPKMISAPKIINDPVFYKMLMKDTDVETSVKGITTMGSDFVTFISEDDNVSIKISDKNGDMFTHDLDTEFEIVDPSAAALAKTYKAKTLKTIFTNYIRKDDYDILPIMITKRGVMKLTVLGLGIYLFPER